MDEQAETRRAIAGDMDAIRAFWRRNRRWVAAELLAQMPRGAELEDLMQEVALKVVESISSVRSPGRARAWLRAVAVNTARTAGRRQRPALRLAGGGSDRRDAANEPAAMEPDQIVHREEARRALEAASRLPEKYREPLLLRCAQEMTYAQIASALEIPVSTVETRLARARKMLRDEAPALDAAARETA